MVQSEDTSGTAFSYIVSCFSQAFEHKDHANLAGAESLLQRGRDAMSKAEGLSRLQGTVLRLIEKNVVGSIHRQRNEINEADLAYREALEHLAGYFGRGIAGTWAPPYYMPCLIELSERRSAAEDLLAESVFHVFHNRAQAKIELRDLDGWLQSMVAAFDIVMQSEPTIPVARAVHITELVQSNFELWSKRLDLGLFFLCWLSLLIRRTGRLHATLADALADEGVENSARLLARAMESGLLARSMHET